MTKNEYLSLLRQELGGLPYSDINDILRDQEEYISEALRCGRNESDVIQSLGPVSDLARELKVGHQIKTASSETRLFPKVDKIFKAIIAICLLAPLNLVIVLGPFLALCGILFACWAIGGSGVTVGFVGVGLSFFTLPLSFFLFLTLFFGSLTAIGFSILFLSGCYFLTSLIFKGTIAYLKWNLELVTGGKI